MKQPTPARAAELRRGQAYFEQVQRQRRETRDTYARYHRERRIAPRAGDCYGDCRGNMANLDCAGLAREKAATQDAQARHGMASESYEADPSKRKPPPGYSNATNADLEKLGLRNPNTGEDLTRMAKHPDFNSAVFKNDRTGEYVIGFKGTDPTSLSDWGANAGQNFGGKTAYYSRAMEIGRLANATQPGKVSFVGHSLGGGLASAAAGATGRPATTFNAAGLHPNTVPNFNPNTRIDSWYVQGDALTAAQNIPGIKRANGRRIMIKPPLAWSDLTLPTSLVTRHLNGRITAALDRRMETIEELQKSKGCPQ